VRAFGIPQWAKKERVARQLAFLVGDLMFVDKSYLLKPSWVRIRVAVSVLDSGVSRSTCSWAISTAQLWPLGAGRRLKPNGEDPREEEPHEENNGEALETRRYPHDGFLMRRKTRSMTAQHNPVLMKG
jgi:hypothetical protein